VCKGRGFISTTKILRRMPETIPFVGHGGHNSYYYCYYRQRHRCVEHTRAHMLHSFSRPHHGEQMQTTSLSSSDIFPPSTQRTAGHPSKKTLRHQRHILIIIMTYT